MQVVQFVCPYCTGMIEADASVEDVPGSGRAALVELPVLDAATDAGFRA